MNKEQALELYTKGKMSDTVFGKILLKDFPKLSQEQIDFIKNLSNEIKAQDNRGTSSPYSYRVQQSVRVYDTCAGHYRNTGISICGEAFDDIEDAIEYMDDEGEFELRGLDDLIEYLDREGIEYYTYSWQMEDRLCYGFQGGANTFLTKKACIQYIESNKHNLSNPQSYVVGEYRNPEMEKLYEIIHNMAEVL